MDMISRPCSLDRRSFCQGIRPIVTSFRPVSGAILSVVAVSKEVLDFNVFAMATAGLLDLVMIPSLGVMNDDASMAANATSATAAAGYSQTTFIDTK